MDMSSNLPSQDYDGAESGRACQTKFYRNLAMRYNNDCLRRLK